MLKMIFLHNFKILNKFQITKKLESSWESLKSRKFKQARYHCRGWQMKGSLGLIFFGFFPLYFLMILFYMVAHDLMCDKDLKLTYL